MEPNIAADPCSLTPAIKYLANIVFSKTVIAAVLASIVAPLIGLQIFYRQREYELVRQRYLDEGLDVISGNVEYAQSVFRHNWARSLELIKQFRDAGKDTATDLYSSGFVSIDPNRFDISKNYILRELVGDDIYSKVHELLFAFVNGANSYFMNDLCHVVKMYVEGTKELTIKATNKEIAEKYTQYSVDKDKEIRKYYSLLGELRLLSAILVREKFTFKDINNFKTKPEVKESIKRLTAEFENDLSA